MNKDCQINAVSDREEKIFFAWIRCLGQAIMAAQLLNPMASATTSANQAA